MMLFKIFHTPSAIFRSSPPGAPTTPSPAAAPAPPLPPDEAIAADATSEDTDYGILSTPALSL